MGSLQQPTGPTRDGKISFETRFEATQAWKPLWLCRAPRKTDKFDPRPFQTRGFPAAPSAFLTSEIASFTSWLSPQREDEGARCCVLARFQAALDTHYGKGICTAIPFGSYLTRTYLPTGDVDVRLRFRKGAILGNSKKVLRRLSEVMRTIHIGDSPLAKELEFVSNARIPVIKYVDALCDVPVDIAVGGGDVEAWLHNQMATIPALYPLIITIKALLDHLGLKGGQKGGLNSCAICIMIVCFLNDWTLGRPDRDYDLGALLIGFLEFYSVKHDIGAVDITHTGLIARSSPGRIRVVNPCNGENCAASCVRVPELVTRLRLVLKNLKAFLRIHPLYPSARGPGTPNPEPLPPKTILGGVLMFNIAAVEDIRAALRALIGQLRARGYHYLPS